MPAIFHLRGLLLCMDVCTCLASNAGRTSRAGVFLKERQAYTRRSHKTLAKFPRTWSAKDFSILFSDAAWAPQLLEGSRHMASTRRLGSVSEVIELELLASCSCAVFRCGRRSISVPGEQCSKIVSMITSDLLTLPSFVVVLMNLPAARMHMIASRLPQLWESKRFSS